MCGADAEKLHVPGHAARAVRTLPAPRSAYWPRYSIVVRRSGGGFDRRYPRQRGRVRIAARSSACRYCRSIRSTIAEAGSMSRVECRPCPAVCKARRFEGTNVLRTGWSVEAILDADDVTTMRGRAESRRDVVGAIVFDRSARIDALARYETSISQFVNVWPTIQSIAKGMVNLHHERTCRVP